MPLLSSKMHLKCFSRRAVLLFLKNVVHVHQIALRSQPIWSKQRQSGNWIEICIAIWKQIANVGVATDALLW